MPDFSFSQALTANQADFRPLQQWAYRVLPFRALVTVFMRATDGNTRQTVSAGAQVIRQRSPINAGGTAGHMPTIQDTIPTQFHAAAGDELIVSIDEVAGGTPTVDGYVNVDPT